MPKLVYNNCKQRDARQIVKRCDYESAAITEASYPRGQEVSRHVHALPYLGVLIRGECAHGVGITREEKAVPGELHYLPSGEAHSFSFYVPAHCLLVQVNQPTVERFKEYAKLDFKAGRQAGEVFYDLGQRLIREARQDDDASSLAVECLVLEAFTQMCRNKALPGMRPFPALLRARDLIHDRMGGTLKLGDIARQVGLHPAHLAREFRRFFKRTMSEYLREVRVQKAKDLLPESDVPLSEISQLCGFCDQSHFSKCFRQLVGTSPSAYRREHYSHSKILNSIQMLQN